MTHHEEAAEMQAYLEITPSDNPAELSDRIKTLAVYQARSGYMLAEAKKTLSEKMLVMATIVRWLVFQHRHKEKQNC